MAKSTSKRPAAAKTAKKKTTAPAARTEQGHGHDEDVVTFNLSPSTSKTIDAALKGLNAKQQDRVMEAVDAVGDEIGVKVGRWVENNFIRNANELLAVLTPILVKDGLWNELRGIWAFLEELDVKVNHKQIGKTVEKELGAHIAGHYRDVVSGVKGTVQTTTEVTGA
jgi:hypothetical protein